MSQRTEKKIGKRSQATGAKRQLILTAALAVFSQYGIARVLSRSPSGQASPKPICFIIIPRKRRCMSQ